MNTLSIKKLEEQDLLYFSSFFIVLVASLCFRSNHMDIVSLSLMKLLKAIDFFVISVWHIFDIALI